jgi:hypothetical protein
VHENVRTILAADKSETLRIVEPFNGSFQFHFAFLRAVSRLHPTHGCCY